MDRNNLSPHPNEDIIGHATSVDEIIAALATRGCKDLTSSVDPEACSTLPHAGGGFCDVFEGNLHDGTRIAIKSLRVYPGPKADSDRAKLLKHAARELYHWSKLQHPNVLPLLGLLIFQGRISMVSEWMDNGNLMYFIRSKPDTNRIRLCMDISDGLCYIHAQGMTHGDLKAANVMVSSHGVAMIADFGNARLKDLTLKFSNTTGLIVSVRWTAPELLDEDDSSQGSKEGDVYAYGMTVLEVTTGEIPYQDLAEHIVLKLVSLQQKRPSRPQTGLDDGLWELVENCWTGDPVERPSMESVNERLQALYPDCKPLSQEPGAGAAHPLDTSNKRQIRTNLASPVELTNLGISFHSRFERLGNLEDLEKAIEKLSRAVNLTPDDHAERPNRLICLGTSHRSRFERLGDLEDADKSIECHTQAVLLTPDGHPQQPSYFDNLGASYRARFERLGELADLDKAIELHSRAIALTPEGHANIPSMLNNLGASYRARFERLGELADLDKAIECQTQAMLLTPDQGSSRPAGLESASATEGL